MSITNIKPNEVPAQLLSPKGRPMYRMPRWAYDAFKLFDDYCASHELKWVIACEKCRQPLEVSGDGFGEQKDDVFACACREHRHHAIPTLPPRW